MIIPRFYSLEILSHCIGFRIVEKLVQIARKFTKVWIFKEFVSLPMLLLSVEYIQLEWGNIRESGKFSAFDWLQKIHD